MNRAAITFAAALATAAVAGGWLFTKNFSGAANAPEPVVSADATASGSAGHGANGGGGGY